MEHEEQDDGAGIPEWVVTFGDMMSLLLTFFIMLVSLSEIKEEDKYQAMVDSIRKQFGYTTSPLSLAPGELTPRNSSYSNLSALGRAKVQDTTKGGDKVKAPLGEFPRVRIVRPGSQTTVGTVVFFRGTSPVLTGEAKAALDMEAGQFAGKPQIVEVRGHTSRRRPESAVGGDNWDLAYRRCREVMRYLADEKGIERHRIRLSVAAEHDPLRPEHLEGNARVEVFLLDEVSTDPAAAASRAARPISSP